MAIDSTEGTNAVLTVLGTAGDNMTVTEVTYRVDDKPFQGADGTTNWSVTALLNPGTNRFHVQSLDGAGNYSLTNSRAYFYVVPKPLLLTMGSTGKGTVTGATNGQKLEIGRGYQRFATNAPGSRFTGWSGDLTSTNPTLRFLMQSNFSIQANFADVQKPSVVITAPAPNSQVSNTFVRLQGKAADNVQVANVLYQVNTGPFQSAIGTTNWMASLALQPGTNIVRATSVDMAGNVSPISKVTFVYAGVGSVSKPVRMGSRFNISVVTVKGRRYVLE